MTALKGQSEIKEGFMFLHILIFSISMEYKGVHHECILDFNIQQKRPTGSSFPLPNPFFTPIENWVRVSIILAKRGARLAMIEGLDQVIGVHHVISVLE